MNRQQQKALERIDKKISTAKASNNLFKVIQLTQERNKIVNLQRTEVKMSLYKALEQYTPEERRRATVEIIYAVATADLLYGITIDVHDTLKKCFGIDGIPMLEELRTIVKKLAAIVKTIDDVGIMDFSLNYADIVDKIETKYGTTMKNYIHNEIIKSSKNR